MAKMIAYFSLTPKKIISSIDKIEIHASTHEDHSTYLALSEYLSHFRNKQKYYRVEYKNETYHTLETDYGMLTYFHELGHAYTNKRFGEKIPPGYKQAVEVDKNSVSKYGDTNIQEDFAETFALYLLLRNTKSTDPTAFSKISKSLFEKRTDGVFHLVSEKINKSTSEITPDDVRKMYVNRFKIIDGLLEKDPTLKDRFLLHLDKNPIVQASLVGAIGVGAFVILIQSTLDK